MPYDLLLQEIQGLPDEMLLEILHFARFIKVESLAGEGHGKEQEKKTRRAGLLRGQIRMTEDFDAPLEEFGEYT